MECSGPNCTHPSHGEKKPEGNFAESEGKFPKTKRPLTRNQAKAWRRKMRRKGTR